MYKSPHPLPLGPFRMLSHFYKANIWQCHYIVTAAKCKVPEVHRNCFFSSQNQVLGDIFRPPPGLCSHWMEEVWLPTDIPTQPSSASHLLVDVVAQPTELAQATVCIHVPWQNSPGALHICVLRAFFRNCSFPILQSLLWNWGHNNPCCSCSPVLSQQCRGPPAHWVTSHFCSFSVHLETASEMAYC